MSHYSVLVALPGKLARADLHDALTAAMAPFDENTETEPYRKYEEGGPENHWFVEAMRRSARDLAVGAGIKPYKPDELGWSSASSKKTPVEQLADLRCDVAVAEKLGPSPTWPQVIAAMIERWTGEMSDLLYDEESDRAYTMSTYNPASKWDYWRIGGRWGGYFRALPDRDVLRCDGGRKRDLDLDGMRAAKAAEAEQDWNDYWLTVHGTPEALPWRAFAEKIDTSGNGGYDRETARRDHRAQPRVAALNASEKFRDWWGDAIEAFERFTRDEYAARAASRAVPGYATLDVAMDGQWLSPGRMGWFGASSDDEASYAEYVKRANDYIDSLPDDAWLVVLDCHI
jgi:hypothetical protein